MTVSIRFDHGEHLGGTDPLPHNFCILPQCVAVDFSPTTKGFLHFGMVMCGSRK